MQLTVDDESEVEAAVLLLKCMYSTADAGQPLRGASQSLLLQVLWLADQLQAAQAGLAAEQQARLAAQQELAQLQRELEQAQQQRRVSCVEGDQVSALLLAVAESLCNATWHPRLLTNSPICSAACLTSCL